MAACSAAVVCSGGLFCISTVVVLVYLVSVDNMWGVLQFWDELTCDVSNIVCLVHEFVGRLLLVVVMLAVLLLAFAAAVVATATSGGGTVRAVYVNACLINCWIFIYFLVRLAFRPSRGAPNAPQLGTTIASSSTTLAPTTRHQRLTTIGGWCDPIIQPFLSRFSSRRFCFQAFL